jgi:integrase
MSRIRVGVISRKDCRNLVMRFKDPVTGRWSCSTKYRDPQTGEVIATGTNRKEAEKLAARWEADLNAGRDQGSGTIRWRQFRLRYEDEVVPGLAEKTARKIVTVFNAVEKALPKVTKGKLTDLTAEAISRFQAEMRDGKRSEDTIAGYLAHLRAALQWAADQGMIFMVPKIRKPQRAKRGGSGHKSKGRPITTEEFERLLEKIPAALVQWRKLKREAARKTRRNNGQQHHKTQTDAVPVEVSPAAVASWRHYLTGLWLSGLRLDESFNLYWDRPDRLHIDLTGRRPRLSIPGELEKGHRDRLLPITPDFASHLLATEDAARRGPVFRPLMPSGNRANPDQAGRMISLMGELAGVKVHTHVKTGKVKFASAHDLRRSFGTRWARRVPTAVLMLLMRHESIQTTNAYYVDLDTDEIAEDLYRVSGQADTVPSC